MSKDSKKRSEATNSLGKALEVIEEGGMVVYPTETAYGIAADATNSDAVEKVYEAKDRPKEKGLTAIVRDLEQAEDYAELTEKERKIVKKLMPGPLTLVTEKKETVPDNLNEKFVFRISSSSLARSLAENVPVTATSANISGKSTSYAVEDIDEGLLDEVGAIIDHGRLEERETSTIAEVKNSEIVIHRKGPVERSDIEKVFD